MFRIDNLRWFSINKGNVMIEGAWDIQEKPEITKAGFIKKYYDTKEKFMLYKNSVGDIDWHVKESLSKVFGVHRDKIEYYINKWL